MCIFVCVWFCWNMRRNTGAQRWVMRLFITSSSIGHIEIVKPPPPPPQALPSSSSSFIPPPKPPVSCVEVCFLPYLYWENSFLRLVPSFGAVNNLLYFHSDAVGIYSKEDFRKDSYITDLAEHYCSTFPHRSPFTLLCTFLTWPCTPLPETS